MRETLEASWGTSEGRVSIWHRRAPGKGTPVNAQRWFDYPRQFDAVIDFVQSIKDKDVYFSPPVYDQDSRTPDHAKWVSTIWCDADLCHPDNFRLPPSRTLRTSVGNGDRWQCFWDLAEPVTAMQASAIAHKIALAHKDQGADLTSWAANKLMRIPGTANTNWGDWTVEEIPGTGELYSELDLLDAYEDITIPEGIVTPARVIQKAEETPVIEIEGLPDYEKTLGLIPSSEHRLYDLIWKEPKGGPEGWRSEQLWALLLDLYRFGFSTEQALSIAWHAPTTSKVRDDERGFSWLQQQAEKAKLTVDQEKGRNEVAPEDEKPKRGAMVILSSAERAVFKKRTTWDTEYMAWARTKINAETFNAPYHEAMMWTILGCAIGGVGYIPKKKGPMPVSMYIMILGPSSSGKSEAKDVGWPVIRSLFHDESVDIGGESSKNALLEQLMARDGKTSLIHADEAHEKFREMKSASWTNGIQGIWTDIHGGKIPPLGRVGKTELANPNATGVVYMHMMGTMEGMLDVLDKSMFASGYLARQVWFVGKDLPVTKSSLAEDQAEDDDDHSYEGMPKYWSGKFREIRSKLLSTRPGERWVGIKMTQEVLERHQDMKFAVTTHYQGSGESDIYTPAIRRFSDNVRKAATLLAMAEGKTVVDMNHWIAAAGHAEKWLQDFEEVADGIRNSFFSKRLDEIEKFISEKNVLEVPIHQIYTHSKESKRATDEYLGNLVAQRRIKEINTPGHPTVFRSIKKDIA